MLGIAVGGWLADRYFKVNPRALFLVPGLAMLGSIPFVLMAIFGRNEGVVFLGVFVAIALCSSTPALATPSSPTW